MVWAKGRQIFFSGKTKQNIVGAKERQIFFRGRAKQNKVGGKEQLGCPALMLEQKRDNRVTLFLQLYFVSLYRQKRFVSLLHQLYFVSFYRIRRFVFLLLQPFLCFIFYKLEMEVTEESDFNPIISKGMYKFVLSTKSYLKYPYNSFLYKV